MIARLVICSNTNKIKEEIQKTLASHLPPIQSGLTIGNTNHPDLLRIQAGEKLGIAEAKKIKEFFSLKPYSAKGRAVVLEDASALTHEAQNALLKTIEELSREAILILGASSDANLLPTIISRCQVVILEGASATDRIPKDSKSDSSQASLIASLQNDLEKLLNSTTEERFEYIEKLKEREEFLHSMVYFFRQKMVEPITHARRPLVKLEVANFLKELLQSEEWAKRNVNIRAILEYLMLVMPEIK